MTTLRICPVTGKKTATLVPSSIREGVLISPESRSTEALVKSWWVDEVKATKALQGYFKLLTEYDIAYNCSDDRKKVERLEKRVETAKRNRTQKYVVYVESPEGSSPLAEFADENLARAKVFGWLGRNYNHYGKNRWIGAYGSIIAITNL